MNNISKLSNNKKIILTAGVVLTITSIGILTVRLFRKKAEKKSYNKNN